MRYRLPDGSESMRTLGAAWVKRDPEDAKGWLPRRGRPPEGTLNEGAARAALRAYLDQQTDRTPLERISFERCADAFLEHCRERGRSPTTLRTCTPIAGELKARWQGWRAVDVDADELEDYRDELAERVSPAARSTSAAPCCRASSRSRADASGVNVDPMDGFERTEVEDSGDFKVYSVEEVWALVRAAGSGLHHTGQRAYTRTSKTGRQVHIPERPFTAEELAGRRQQDLYDAAAILTAALCGLRRSELLGLLWRAVLWEQQTILVRRSFTEVGGDRLPKGQRVHSVPAAQQVLDLLTRLQALQGDPEPDDRVFQGSRARRWTAPRCIAATASSRRPPASGRCASTTSVRPSPAAPRSRRAPRPALHRRRIRARRAARRARRPRDRTPDCTRWRRFGTT